ncbi:hypothetical protein F5Y04DRAFT_242447 [Hypomontagnella monticulosa]|nr:hypothetical protein F5Y04DRAFT_242447 [Hypomontagnella monticulosa]
MASRSARERRFVSPPGTAGDATETGTEPDVLEGGRRKRRKRDANVYDAVAGRVTSTLPLDDGSGSEEAPSHHFRPSRDRRRDPTLAPEEVLFRRVGAPVRFAEKDIYQAHEDLRDGGRGVLPDSDMVKALHSYASHFYAALARRGSGGAAARNIDERSMDETALLAFGILVEEAGREVLGRSGDLVFTEGAQIERKGGQEQEEEENEGVVAVVEEPGDDAETVDFKANVIRTGRR